MTNYPRKQQNLRPLKICTHTVSDGMALVSALLITVDEKQGNFVFTIHFAINTL